MPRNVKQRVKELSNVGKLVHLAARMDSTDENRIRKSLVKARRRAYEDELTIQAGRLGCSNRTGSLVAGHALSAMNKESKADAKSIVNTYNWDLAGPISGIRRDVPRANRHTYAARLRSWEAERNPARAAMIGDYADGQARSRAQKDFVKNNGLGGYAMLVPGVAAEAVCAGWIGRGRVPLREAMANPPPYHPRCPHLWDVFSEQLPKGECSDIWVG